MRLDPTIVLALQEVENVHGVARDVIIESLKEAIRTAYYKTNGPVDNLVVDVQLGEDNEIEAYLRKVVVAEVQNERTEISLEDARAETDEAEEGDILLTEVPLDNLNYLAIHYAKQKIVSVIKDAKRTNVLQKYKDRQFQIISGSILYVEKHDVFVEVDGDVEAILPYREQIQTERFMPGQRIKALLIEVKTARKSPMLVLSRTHPDLIRRLMENEIPEVREGAIEIISIARDPGHRAKVAVRSNIPELDPVGTCIGTKGIRILAISHELQDEKIDLIPFKEDPFEYIREALSPAAVVSVEIFEDDRKAIVIVPNDQISLAIGRGWRNVKLASKITKYWLDVKSMKEIEDGEKHESERHSKKGRKGAGKEKQPEPQKSVAVAEVPEAPVDDGGENAGSDE